MFKKIKLKVYVYNVVRYNKETREIDDSIIINSNSPLKSGYHEKDDKYTVVDEVLLEAVEYYIKIDVDMENLTVKADMCVKE